MTNQSPRPIGTQFTHVEETETARTIYVYRVTGHTVLHERPSELIQLVAVETQAKPRVGGGERKEE